MIILKGLTVKFDNTTILEDINLELPEGITCALIGPSGCGKSTLLNVLSGLNTNYLGDVFINKRKPSPKEQIIGYIPQNYGLLPWLTVKENILLGLKIKKVKPRILPEDLIENLGLSELLNRYPNKLSGGQRQRVSLARAFALKTDLLLMDEPFSALNAITREEMQDVFIDLWNKKQVSTILVTHYVEEALYLGQKIIVMSTKPGKIYKLIDNPLFGDKNFRDKAEFKSLSKELRVYLQKAGHKHEE